MKLPDPQTVNPEELAANLRMAAELMLRLDGDRDHMNSSRLTCGQVQGAFHLMLMAADAVAMWKDRWESERRDHETTMKQCDDIMNER